MERRFFRYSPPIWVRPSKNFRAVPFGFFDSLALLEAVYPAAELEPSERDVDVHVLELQRYRLSTTRDAVVEFWRFIRDIVQSPGCSCDSLLRAVERFWLGPPAY